MNRAKRSSIPDRGKLLLLSLAAALTLGALPWSIPALAEGDSAERIVIPEDKFLAQQPDDDASAAEDNARGDRHFNFQSFRSRVLGLWFKRKAFLRKNLPETAAEQTQAIEHICQEVGVSRLDEVAAALVHEGHGYLDEGNYDMARAAFADALRFSPDQPDAHFGLATADWRRGGQTALAAQEMIGGLKALLKNESMASAIAGNIIIVLLLAALATTCIFAVAMLVRYQCMVRHDVSEFLLNHYPGRFSQEGLSLVSWVFTLLPLVTWVAVLWTPAYWLATTFRYQKTRERAITAALLLLVVVAAPAARSAEILFGLASDPGARLMLTSTSASYDPEEIVTLEQKAAANPRDPAYRFLLGGMYAHGRYFQEALDQYKKVVDLDPHSHRALNNLGNIYLRTGRPEEALKHYKRAIELRANFLPAYYNSYLARKEMLQLREAEEALKAAKDLDARALARIIEDSKARGAGEPVEAVITREEVFHRILGDGAEGPGIAAAFFSGPSIVALMFLIVGAALWLVFGQRRALRCVRCGDPFCRRCKVGVDSPDYCTQCQHMVTARDGLSPSVRREKGLQTERFRARQMRLSRYSSLLWPGLGRMIDGRVVSGALICSAWCAACLGLFLRPRLLQLPSAGTSHPLFLVTLVLAIIAALAWVAGNLRTVGKAQPAVGTWRWR